MLSQFSEDQFAVRVKREGAAGYISKSDPPERLLEAVRRVAAGLPPSSDARERSAPEARMPHERLTPREHQVFTLVARGRSVTEVAAELNVAVSTVSNHVMNIKGKLGASTLGAVVAYDRVGLIT